MINTKLLRVARTVDCGCLGIRKRCQKKNRFRLHPERHAPLQKTVGLMRGFEGGSSVAQLPSLCLSTLCPSDCIPRFTQGQTRYGATRAAFRASVHFICAGERAAAATRARRYVLEGIVGGVRATRPIAPKRTEQVDTPSRRRGGTIGWPLLCPAQHLSLSQTRRPP